MSVHARDLAIATRTAAHTNDVAALPDVLAAHAALIAKLTQLRPGVIRGDADDTDLEARADHLEEVAKVVDEYVLALGRDAASRASGIDLKAFTGALFGALDGSALYELTSAAERHGRG